MKRLLTTLIILLSITCAIAQKPYTHSIGGSIGFTVNASYKQFVLSNLAIEGEIGCGWQNDIGGAFKLNVNAMYEQAIQSGWYWFVGGGLNFGFRLNQLYYVNHLGKYSDRYRPIFFGINAIGGAEYKFSSIPLTLQADVRPGLIFYTHKYYAPDFSKVSEMRAAFDYSVINISARYTF